MFLVRFIAFLLLILMFIVIGAEGLRLLQGGNDQWISIEQIINFVFMGDTGNQKENFRSEVLGFPAVLTFAVISGILFLLSRKKKPWKCG